MRDSSLLVPIDLGAGPKRARFTFPLHARCPYADEHDHHVVTVTLVSRSQFTSIEAGSINAYIESWADERVSVEALAAHVRDDFRSALHRDDMLVSVSVTTTVQGIELEASA